jgi:MoxR-like ATPase
MNRGEAFAKALNSHDHVHQFQPESTSIQNGILRLTIHGLAVVEIRMVKDHPDIEDLTRENASVPAPSGDDIIDWIDELYRDSREFELGTFDATILGVTLKEQAPNWANFTHGYISDMIALVLQQIAPSRRASDGIRSLLLDDLATKYRDAIDHTQFLLHIELHGTPATYNHYFNESLQKRYVVHE